MARIDSLIRCSTLLAALMALAAVSSAPAQQRTDLMSYRAFSDHFGVYKPSGRIITTTAAVSNVREYLEHDMQGPFQDARVGMNEYIFKVPNGTYRVELYFAEIEQTSIAARVFSVALQGAPVVDRLDIYAEVGANRAYKVVSQAVDVSDGLLRLSFKAIIGEPLLSAISVGGDIAGARTSIERTFYAHMNCGGPAFGGFRPDFGV